MEKINEKKVNFISMLVDSSIEGGVLLQKIQSDHPYSSILLEKDEIIPLVSNLLKAAIAKGIDVTKIKDLLNAIE